MCFVDECVVYNVVRKNLITVMIILNKLDGILSLMSMSLSYFLSSSLITCGIVFLSYSTAVVAVLIISLGVGS